MSYSSKSCPSSNIFAYGNSTSSVSSAGECGTLCTNDTSNLPCTSYLYDSSSNMCYRQNSNNCAQACQYYTITTNSTTSSCYMLNSISSTTNFCPSTCPSSSSSTKTGPGPGPGPGPGSGPKKG